MMARSFACGRRICVDERLVSFDRATTGAFPEDNVIPSGDGSTLYGLTQAGGVNDPKAAKKYGTAFAVTLNR